MPSPKRQRQRAAREAARQAAMAAQKRRARRRQVLLLAGLVGVVLLIGFLVSRGASDDETLATSATSTTLATPTTAPPGAAPDEVCDTLNPDGARTTEFAEEPAMVVDAEAGYSAVVETDLGSFTIDLDAEQAPKTVNNFVFLACHGFYEGVPFHRVITDFVVQGGNAGPGMPGYTFADELPPAGAYEIGSVVMANSGPNTNSSQFFVVSGEAGVSLPPDYSLFGRVSEGMDVVKAIEADGSPSGKPEVEHRMTKVTIVPTGAPATETTDDTSDENAGDAAGSDQ